MKKLLSLIVLVIVLFAYAGVSADEYVTYYDVIGDIKKLYGENPDNAWTLDRDAAKAVADSWEEYTCRDEKNDVYICEKNHWSGMYMIYLYFSEEGMLAAVNTVLTSPTIYNLNYQADDPIVYTVDELIDRFKLLGVIPADAVHYSGESLFPGESTSPYGDIYEIGNNTLLQSGFQPKMMLLPRFYLCFIIRDKSSDYQFPSLLESDGEVLVPMPVVISAAREDDFFGTWIEKYARIENKPMLDDDNNEYLVRIGGSDAIGIMMSMIMGGKDQQEISFTAGHAVLKNNEEGEDLSVETVFQDGKLYIGLINNAGKIVTFEMNDNGMISTVFIDGLTHYYVKQEAASENQSEN